MTEAMVETAPARKRRWQISNVILIPFYLMAVGFLLRYAVYVRTSGHWGMIEYIRALCVYDCNAYERLALNGYEGRPSGFDKGDAHGQACRRRRSVGTDRAAAGTRSVRHVH